jgi:hypothetical protein
MFRSGGERTGGTFEPIPRSIEVLRVRRQVDERCHERRVDGSCVRCCRKGVGTRANAVLPVHFHLSVTQNAHRHGAIRRSSEDLIERLAGQYSMGSDRAKHQHHI